MEAKEKAKDIYKKVFRFIPQPFKINELQGTEFEGLKFQDWDKDWTNEMTKNCALLLCEEMLEEMGMPQTVGEVERYEFWQEVQKELELK